MILRHLLPMIVGGLMGYRQRMRGVPPAPVALAVIASLVIVPLIWWNDMRTGWIHQVEFFAAYYLLGDHGRRWGRKAKQWSTAQLTAVQEATWRRERALAR